MRAESPRLAPINEECRNRGARRANLLTSRIADRIRPADVSRHLARLLVRPSRGRIFGYVVRPLARREDLVPLLRAVVALEQLERFAYACRFDEPNRRRLAKRTDADCLHVFAP